MESLPREYLAVLRTALLLARDGVSSDELDARLRLSEVDVVKNQTQAQCRANFDEISSIRVEISAELFDPVTSVSCT